MGEIGVNWSSLITQIVTFVLLLALLRFVAYKPLMRMLDRRAEHIRESMEQAEQVKKQSSEAEEQVKRALEDAGHEGQERIAQAIKVSEEIKDKAKEEAQQQANILIERARTEIHREREEAVNEVRREFGELTVLAAGKVIGKALDAEQHRELIDRVLQESRQKNKG